MQVEYNCRSGQKTNKRSHAAEFLGLFLSQHSMRGVCALKEKSNGSGFD